MKINLTLKDLTELKDNDGMTLENGDKVFYKRGYQVATDGIETRSPIVAMHYIKKYEGTCGVWVSEGVFYIDRSFYISNKREAIRMGIENNQQAIYDWKTGECIHL